MFWDQNSGSKVQKLWLTFCLSSFHSWNMARTRISTVEMLWKRMLLLCCWPDWKQEVHGLFWDSVQMRFRHNFLDPWAWANWKLGLEFPTWIYYIISYLHGVLSFVQGYAFYCIGCSFGLQNEIIKRSPLSLISCFFISCFLNHFIEDSFNTILYILLVLMLKICLLAEAGTTKD